MSDDRDSGVDPRPQRWLVPTDDDDHVDVPVTSTGRHSAPSDDDAPETAAATPSTTEPAPTRDDESTGVWTGSHPDARNAAWSEAEPDEQPDDAHTQMIEPVPVAPADHRPSSGPDWASDDTRTQMIEPVPAEATSVLAAVAADRGAAADGSGHRSPEGGRAATRAKREAASRRPAGPKTAGDRVRTVVRGIGQTLITFGVIVLLFVVYEVYITDIFSAAKQKEATAALDERWVQGDEVQETEVVTVTDPNQLVVDPATRSRSYEVLDGEGFAKISIPAFGPDYHYTIISGTNPDELTTGPGHYPDSQYPGEQGNFAIAGHRVSKGSPFNALDQMNSCDAIIIETQNDWFVYRVLPMENELATWDPAARANCAGVEAPTGEYDGVLGREITLPTDYAQVLPIPHVDSYTVPAEAQRLITLTTCHPQFSDAERMIIHGTLVKTYSKSPGFIPPEMQEG